VTPRLLALGGLLLVVGAAAGIGLWSAFGPAKQSGGGAGSARLSVALPREIRAFGSRITPDGRTIVLSGQARRPDGTTDPVVRLYARPIDRFELKPIAGTENVQQITLSPDGQWIAFLAPISEETSQRRLSKVPLDGNLPPVALADWNDAWGSFTWLEGGDLLITMDASTRFFRLPSGGGPPGQPVKLDLGGISGFVGLGAALPGDRRVFISVSHWSPRGWQTDIWLLDPVTGKASRLLENAGNAAYSPTGHLLFARGDGLFAVGFDADRLRIRGDVTAVQSGVRAQWSWGHGGFSLATRSGTLLFPPGGRVGTRRSLMVVGRAGSPSPYVEERRGFELPPALSRDGRRVAVVIANARGVYEIWCSDLDRPGLRRCAALPGADCFGAIWSPDGRRLAFARQARDKDDGIYLVDADEAGPAEPLVKNGSEKVGHSATSWAPDGSGLLVSRFEEGKGDILFVPVGAGSAPAGSRPFRATPSNEGEARFSTDGRLVAFSSDESGKFEVHVASYRADGTLGLPVLVSRGSGRLAGSPAWSGDSHRLFFVTDAEQLWSVEITYGPRLSASAPVQVLDFRKLRVDPGQYDVLPDGGVLVVQKGEEEDDITQYNLVLNWTEELRERSRGSREAQSRR
jgi:Tol biopolymer transport system component